MLPSPLCSLSPSLPLLPSIRPTKPSPSPRILSRKSDRPVPNALEFHLAFPPVDSMPMPFCNVMCPLLKETPSAEPFNVDPDLVRVLQINQNIINDLEPIFVLHPSLKDSLGTNVQAGWSLIHIISLPSLYKFRRFPQSEALYSQEFSRIVKAKYGSSSVYLNQRLGFNHAHDRHSNHQVRLDRSGKPINYFVADEALKDGLDYKVIKNEWPYAIPRDYQHLIVWSRLPLLNPALSKSPIHWRLAHEEGLAGFVNLSTGLSDRIREFNLQSKANISSDNLRTEDDSSIRLDREIVKFVRNRWRIEEGFEDVMWFLNPVQLQSCPALPHFHVFIKKPSNLTH